MAVSICLARAFNPNTDSESFRNFSTCPLNLVHTGALVARLSTEQINMPQIDDYSTVLLGWFLRSGGTLDTSVMGFHDFEGHGRGTVALQDIPVGMLPPFLKSNLS